MEDSSKIVSYIRKIPTEKGHVCLSSDLIDFLSKLILENSESHEGKMWLPEPLTNLIITDFDCILEMDISREETTTNFDEVPDGLEDITKKEIYDKRRKDILSTLSFLQKTPKEIQKYLGSDFDRCNTKLQTLIEETDSDIIE